MVTRTGTPINSQSANIAPGRSSRSSSATSMPAAAGIDVALDDRDERPGAMFADWELIGVPVRVTIGERSLKEEKLELLKRSTMAASVCDRAGVVSAVRSLLSAN